MHVLILDEGRAGHRNQSRAVVMALRRSFPVEESVGLCKLRLGMWQRPLRWWLNRRGGRLPLAWFGFFYKGDGIPAAVPDLIVSAGGSTVHANVWLARMLGCPNLFCGEIRGLRPDLFQGIISAYESHAGESPYLIAPTPVPIDPGGLAEKARDLRKREGLGEARCWSLLVGGDGAGYRYTEQDWRELAAAMTKLAASHSIRWLVTTSRRSGAVAEDVLTKYLPPQIVAAAAYAGKGQGQVGYHEILGAAERHFCTEDSHMMISEAIASGKPVETLQPARFHTDPSNRHFLEIYQRNGWIHHHAIATLADTDFPYPTPGTQRGPAVLDDLATLLADWWSGLSRDSLRRQAEPGVEAGEAEQARGDT